jgi:glycosyltransferase involved in cell wall biosynthesis
MSSQSKRTGKKSKQVSNHSKKYKIGLGIVTYNRPDYLKQVIQGVINNILDEVDTIWIYDDGSTADYSEVFKNLPSKFKVHQAELNQGVAVAKNWVMNKLLEEGCYCIFVSEDDIIPINKKAIRGYVQASRNTGISHMMFAHHGPGNVDGPIFRSEYVSAYPSCVGAWSFFTRPGLFSVGLHDEKFNNAYEHVELTWRHAKAGLTIPWGAYADATGSEKWIKEIPGSIDNSSIKKSDQWIINTFKALEYWQEKDADFPLKQTLENMKEQMAKDGVTLTTN